LTHLAHIFLNASTAALKHVLRTSKSHDVRSFVAWTLEIAKQRDRRGL
jgi:hypothetical protein